MKTNRQQAQDWWNTLGNKEKDRYTTKLFNLNYVSLNESQIEQVWLSVPIVSKPTPICEYCSALKLNALGICSSCHRFPTSSN